MFSLEQCPFEDFPHFLFGLGFFCCWLVGGLYIFWILTPNQRDDLQMFPCVLAVVFALCWSVVSFDAQTFLILRKSSSTLFSSFVACAFWCHIQEVVTKSSVMKISPCVLGLGFWSIFVFGVSKAQGPAFACGHAVFPVPRVESTILSPIKWSWHPCRNHLTKWARVYFWAFYFFIGQYV